MSAPVMPHRLELDALLKQRSELDERYDLAVAVLEKEGFDHAIRNRVKCSRLYDERAAVQKRIDAFLAAERAT
jgi:hypothetical protein